VFTNQINLFTETANLSKDSSRWVRFSTISSSKKTRGGRKGRRLLMNTWWYWVLTETVTSFSIGSKRESNITWTRVGSVRVQTVLLAAAITVLTLVNVCKAHTIYLLQNVVKYDCRRKTRWVIWFNVPIRSFRRRVFPVNHLHWYWQPNKNNQETEHTNNTK